MGDSGRTSYIKRYFLFINKLLTENLTDLFFVGLKPDVVHREPRRDTMLPEHSVVVGAVWVADTPGSRLHALHESRPGTSYPPKQAQLNKVCE